MAPSRFFSTVPLQRVDPMEQAAAQYFAWLRVEVFDALQIELGRDDANSPHARAIMQLRFLANKDPEVLKAVCFGLTYSFLAFSWEKPTGPGFFDYLALVHSIDATAVAVRTLLSLARRYHRLTELVAKRLLAIVTWMLESRWLHAEVVFLALQREALPGGRADDLAEALLMMLTEANVAWMAEACPAALRLSFLWSLRWAAVDGPRRPHSVAVASLLWELSPRQALIEAGVSLLWALAGAREAAGIEPLWRKAAQDGLHALGAPRRDCLDHLVSHEEQEQLAFILCTGGESVSGHCVGWFCDRHLGCNKSVDGLSAHLGDVVLWAFGFALPEAAMIRQDLWAALWSKSLDLKGHIALCANHGGLAFVFAAWSTTVGAEVLPTFVQNEDVAVWLAAEIGKALPAEVVAEALEAFVAPG